MDQSVEPQPESASAAASTAEWSDKDNWALNGDIRLRWERYPASNPGAPARGNLLLVNGLGSPMVAYPLGFVRKLATRGFDVVRFDNRDAGRSSATEGGYTVSEMATDATVVMDAAGWETAHVLGMSMGGMIVQQLAIEHADRLDSVTSLMSNTGNRDHGRATDEVMEALLLPPPEEREAWIKHTLETGKLWESPGHWTPETSRARAERLFDYGVQIRQTFFQWKAIMDSGDREAALAETRVPMLVMHGTEDTLITPAGGQRTAEVAGNARYVAIDGMGHDLPEAYWAPIADHVVAFVEQVTDGKAGS